VDKHSQKFEVTFDEELRRVLVHGILHLLGRTHATRAPEEPMLIEQERIIKTIGEKIL
jgi:probable rRNA maturation factor